MPSTSLVRLSGGAIEYRLDARGDETVLILHGGHMRADISLGEEVIAELGFSILVPSRPGYGRTGALPDSSPRGFAAALQQLCTSLGIETLNAVVAISGGGRTGLAMAAAYPDLVERLILENAVGFQPWPKPWVRTGARLVFNPVTERLTWSVVRRIMERRPDLGLNLMMRSLSNQPPGEVVAALSVEERATLIDLFSRMRSGRGFMIDLTHAGRPAAWEIRQPTLIIASRGDAAVPLEQAREMKARIPNAALRIVDTDSHFLWFGPGASEVPRRIHEFLTG